MERKDAYEPLHAAVDHLMGELADLFAETETPPCVAGVVLKACLHVMENPNQTSEEDMKQFVQSLLEQSPEIQVVIDFVVAQSSQSSLEKTCRSRRRSKNS